MANILEFLRGVLTEPDAQSAFRADPTGHLERSGFGDLTGEDVVEGVAVLRRSLAPEVADALGAFDDEDDLPPVRPANDESELDAAIRVLGFAVDQVPIGGGAQAPEPEPEHHEPEPDEEPEPEPAEEGAYAEDAVDRGSGAGGTPVGPSESVSVDIAALPSVSAFAESLAAVATDARSRSEGALARLTQLAEAQAAATKAAFDEALGQIVAEAEAAARQTAGGYEELLRRAEGDANGIRGEADAYAADRRNEADGDREAARLYLERTRQESEEMLGRSQQQADEARQQADELMAASRAEAEAARAEIDARRAEMREAERQLKERLSGIDSLFRTVLRDDEGGDGGGA